MSPQDTALLATARWEGTPGSIESLQEGKKRAASHPLLALSFDKLVALTAAEPVQGQKKLASEDPFSKVALPAPFSRES